MYEKIPIDIYCKKKNKGLVWLLVLACFLSNISQLPGVVSAGLTQKINMPIWIIFLGYLFLSKNIKVYYRMLPIIALLGMSGIGILVLEFFNGINYYTSSIFNCLLLSIFIYFLGECSGSNLDSEDINKVMLSYVLSTVIVSIAIYLEYFSSGINLSSKVYAYSSKNSISQIIFTAIVILMFTKFENHRLLNSLRLLLIVFQVFLLMLLRSRATIIGFIICLLYIIVGRNFNTKIKYSLCLILGVTAVLLLFNDNFSSIFFNNILFAGRDASNLNSLTSGRLTIVQSFPNKIEGHWLTGTGPTYFECFPLSAILQFGIVVGTMILIISYTPIFKCFQLRRTSEFGDIFVVICMGYAINSLFEGLAPIGPGVKCYFMWLLFGVLSSNIAGGISNQCQN